MRNLRSATPVPPPLHLDVVCRDVSPSRRSNLLSQHLPSLTEGLQESNGLTKIISPVFSSSELGRTEIVELVGSPSNLRRRQLLKSHLERRRKSEEPARLPTLNNGESAKENVQSAGSPQLNLRAMKHSQLTRCYSHPVISKPNNLPRLSNWDLHSQANLKDEHSAEIRRHIQQEDIDYDFFSTKAVILERYLNSQSAA